MPSIRQALLLFPAAITAITFNCEHVRVDGKSFNLEKLDGPKQVHWTRPEVEFVVNTTFTIDLCHPLKPGTSGDEKARCDSGARVCGIERDYDLKGDGTGRVREVINVAGEFQSSGRHLDPQVTRLKSSSSNSDAVKEGLRVEFNGGSHGDSKRKRYQRAIIELLCDADLEGTEGFEDSEKMVRATSFGAMSRREDEEAGDGEEKDEEGENDDELPDLDKGKALQFLSYGPEDELDVLRLEWKTKWACEDALDKDGGKKAGWGFFTWFLIIVFLLAAAYIIFGSWLNYNRYGARGWDLIPHGDTIRDLPYIVKDLFSGLMAKFSGSGSRGGYSAV